MLDANRFEGAYWLRVRSAVPGVVREVVEEDEDLREAIEERVEEPALRADVEYFSELMIEQVEERESR